MQTVSRCYNNLLQVNKSNEIQEIITKIYSGGE